MRLQRVIAMVTMALVAGWMAQAQAGFVGLSGKKAVSCAAGWAVPDVDLTGKKGNQLDCQDGDSRCDDDGVVNGQCAITISACVYQSVEGCTPEATTSLKLKPTKKIGQLAGFQPPTVGATEASCGEPGTITLAVKHKKKGDKPSKKFTVKAIAKSTSGKGKALVSLRCIPSGGSTGTAQCPKREAPGLPEQITYTVPASGTDLDNGWSGDSHNFPTPEGSTLSFCLSDCDATTNPVCTGNGPTGEGSVNGPAFGPPLPLLAANVPVCVINRYAGDMSGVVNLRTGEATAQVNLLSDVYLSIDTPAEVCPRCNTNNGGIGAKGTCSSSARRAGQACTVEGLVPVSESAGDKLYKLSRDCLPQPGLRTGTLTIGLPLTTGESMLEGTLPLCKASGGVPTQQNACSGGSCSAECTGNACKTRDAMNRCIDSKGGISQVCCSNDSTKPCFPEAESSMTPGQGLIARTGMPMPTSPLWPDTTYPKTGAGNVFAATFCEGATNSSQVDILTGLPGPGALLLSGNVTVTATTEAAAATP